MECCLVRDGQEIELENQGKNRTKAMNQGQTVDMECILRFIGIGQVTHGMPSES